MGGTALQEIGRSLRVLHVMPERGEERRLLLSAVHCESLSPTTPPPIFKGQVECVFLIFTYTYLCVWEEQRGWASDSNRGQAKPRPWRGCREKRRSGRRDSTLGGLGQL